MKKLLRNERGQASMEAILIMIALTCVAVKISSVFKSQGYIADIVEGPWSPIRGMIEDGVWVKYQNSKSMHPNHLIRHQSKRGDST